MLKALFWLGLFWWLFCCNSREEQPPESFKDATRGEIRDAMRNKKEDV